MRKRREEQKFQTGALGWAGPYFRGRTGRAVETEGCCQGLRYSQVERVCKIWVVSETEEQTETKPPTLGSSWVLEARGGGTRLGPRLQGSGGDW